MSLRDGAIRLAYSSLKLRPHLLPLLVITAEVEKVDDPKAKNKWLFHQSSGSN